MATASGGLIGYRDQIGVPPQRGAVRRDIRKHIAMLQTPAYDPEKFPRPEYQRYPLMPLQKNANGKDEPYRDPIGRAIVLRNADEEEHFYRDHPDAQRVKDAVDMRTELEQLREENSRLRGNPTGVPPGRRIPAEDLQQAEAAAKSPARGVEEAHAMRAEERNPVAGMTQAEEPAPKKKVTGPKPGSKLD